MTVQLGMPSSGERNEEGAWHELRVVRWQQTLLCDGRNTMPLNEHALPAHLHHCTKCKELIL